jgi:hypothetical protein
MKKRVLLLGSQTVLLGLYCAFLIVPASALFLAHYGAENLPYAYLGVAAAGVLVSTGMRRAQARLSLGALAATVIAVMLLLVTGAWLVLSTTDGLWATFPLLVLFPVSIPVGFVLIGSQAGRLMDVREMKAHFPRVVAGFSVGFAGGGLLAAWLVHVLDGPVGLLGLAAAAAGGWLVVLLVTANQYSEILLVRPAGSGPAHTAAPQRVSLLRDPLVLAVFGYQVLSAAVTQLLDYMVWERAAARYPDASDLAQFQGIFGAVINVVSVVFVILLAGRLLTRLGVGASLAANPVGVLVVLAVTVVLGYGGGILGTTFFLLVCASQVVDITLTDGSTRTSINATYQALPAEDRLAAQTAVEGAGVPLALGFVGALLLVFQALSLDVRAVAVVTLALTVGWLVLSRLAAHGYVGGLRNQFSRTAWDPAPLQALDEPTLAAADRLLVSPDVRDVRVAIGALASGGRPALLQIGKLLDDRDPRVRLQAAAVLAGMPDEPETRALSAWRSAVHGTDPELVSTAIEAAAEHPAECFVPDLVAVAAGASPPPILDRALAAHADHLVELLEGVDGEECPRTARAQLLRAVGRARLPSGRPMLVNELTSGDAAVRGAAALSLAAAPAAGPDDLPPTHALLSLEATYVAGLLAVLDALPSEPGTEPLRRALGDELAAAADRTGVVLALAGGGGSVVHAAESLRRGDQRGLALELIEVAAGRRDFGVALALLDPSLGEAQRQAGLAEFAPSATDAAGWVHALITDPDGSWHSPWLRACALYASPTVLGAAASDLAAGWLDASDPVVAETARWVVSAAG